MTMQPRASLADSVRVHGATMDWDQTLAYTITQTTQTLSELRARTGP